MDSESCPPCLYGTYICVAGPLLTVNQIPGIARLWLALSHSGLAPCYVSHIWTGSSGWHRYNLAPHEIRLIIPGLLDYWRSSGPAVRTKYVVDYYEPTAAAGEDWPRIASIRFPAAVACLAILAPSSARWPAPRSAEQSVRPIAVLLETPLIWRIS